MRKPIYLDYNATTPIDPAVMDVTDLDGRLQRIFMAQSPQSPARPAPALARP